MSIDINFVDMVVVYCVTAALLVVTLATIVQTIVLFKLYKNADERAEVLAEKRYQASMKAHDIGFRVWKNKITQQDGHP